jgi:hypothetical protein
VKAHVFRLEDPASGALTGIVVTFATTPQEVWLRLGGDGEAREIPHSVASNEAAQLETELGGLTPGDVIGGGPRTLLGQLSEDAEITGDHRLRFAETRKFKVFVRSPASFRGWVEHWFKEEQDTEQHE